jgi:hypothetical protein
MLRMLDGLRLLKSDGPKFIGTVYIEGEGILFPAAWRAVPI